MGRLCLGYIAAKLAWKNETPNQLYHRRHRPGGPRRCRAAPVGARAPTLDELIADALSTLQADGLPLERLELNSGWRRKHCADHLWYAADTGKGRSGRRWLMVTAGDARQTGDVSTPLMIYKSWETDRASVHPDEVRDIQLQIEEAARRREAQDRARRDGAAQQGRELWGAASEECSGHPYLIAKGVEGYRIRRSGDRLLIPVADCAGTIHGVQAIGPDGTKRFNSGAAITGHYHLLGTPGGRLYLCEGYATGATIHAATGAAVAVAFHAGNLEPVAKALRQAHPGAEVVVCADDDRHTEGNPGVTHARAAAAAVGGSIVVPRFQRSEVGGTDFNDMARLEGLATVRDQVQRVERVSTGLSIIPADRLHPEPISWLWDGWLARGKVHVLAGAPGTGKTSLALALTATLTTAGRWPDGTTAGVGSVLIWSGEDDPRDTLVPRLLACGADLSRVSFVGSVVEADGTRSFDPARDGDLLREHAAAMDPPPALLIVDPIVSAVAGGDSHKNAEVRRALQPLVDLAVSVRCVVLGISHFSKGTAGRDPVERVTGSLAFGALARVVLAAAKLSEDDGGGRMLARAKNNIGIDSGGYGYDLEPLELPDHPGVHTTRVVWGAPMEGTARELLSKAESLGDPEEQSAMEDAKEWLGHTLRFGPVDGKEIKKLARAEGIAERTLYRAAGALGVARKAAGFGKSRSWSMCAKTSMCATENGVADIGTHGTDDMSANACQPQNLGTHGGGEPDEVIDL
jgi:putative DNA primase/helicase